MLAKSFRIPIVSYLQGLAVLLATITSLFVAERCVALELKPGDILTAGNTLYFDGENSYDYRAIVHVDPVAHVSQYLSGGGVGSGPDFVNPTGVAVLGTSDVFVADGPRIFRVDPESGNRSILSGLGVGSGPAIQNAHGIWLRDDDALLVVDYSAKSVLSVDLATGDRTVISSPSLGVGPALIQPYDLTTTLDGRILVTSFGATTEDDVYNAFVVAIDPSTGNRSILTDATHGGGPGFVSALGITRRASGKILVTDNWPAKVYEIDPVTGAQTVFSQSGSGTPVANQFVSPLGIVEGLDGSVYFNDVDYAVMHIGSGGGLASGIQLSDLPRIGWSDGIAIVTVPEPTSDCLAAVGMAIISLRCFKARKWYAR